MKISELARHAQVRVDTVRHYERERLLPTPSRRASGYREYGPDDVLRLRFVRRAKALGFTLQEIRDLLALSARRHEDMAGLKSIAAAKLLEIENKIKELERIRDGLAQLTVACPGHGALSECPILGALSGNQS